MTIQRPPVLPHVDAAMATYNADIIQEVATAIAAEKVVIVGVSGLAPGKTARRLLDEQKVPYRYLEYGSYFKGYRRRLALKLWVQWPTFPLVFVRGTFVGGASDLRGLIEKGELAKMLAS